MSYHTSGTTTTSQSTTSYQGRVAPPGYHYMPDGTLMLDSNMIANDLIGVDTVAENLITSFNMDYSSLLASGGSKSFSLTGSSEATFEITVTNEDNSYYNFYTKTFQTEKSVLSKSLSKSGVFNGSIKFPLVTDDDYYDISITTTGQTKQTRYNEVRFGDGSVDVNSSTGSNSILMKKVIYQYVALALTITTFGTQVAHTVVNAVIPVSSGAGLTNLIPFSIPITCANDKALKILKQPTHLDVLSFSEPTISAVPIFIPGENIYPAITTAGNNASEAGTTVNNASTGKTVTTHVVSSTIATVGDRVTGPQGHALNDSTVTVLTVSTGSGKTFTINQDISIADDLVLVFSNQKNYRWEVNNFAHVMRAGAYCVPTASLTENATLANYSDTTTVLSGTEQEKVYINHEIEAVSTLGFKPTITNGIVTTQPGAIVFNEPQPLSIAGLMKVGGYGQGAIFDSFGYDVVFSDLAIALTPVTTTTTAASAGGSSTGVVLTSMNGILNAVSTVSGIGIDPNAVDPTVASGAGSAGGGTIVLSAAQSLESGATLTFANAGLVATVTGNIQVLKAGTASATIRLDVDRLLQLV